MTHDNTHTSSQFASDTSLDRTASPFAPVSVQPVKVTPAKLTSLQSEQSLASVTSKHRYTKDQPSLDQQPSVSLVSIAGAYSSHHADPLVASHPGRARHPRGLLCVRASI